MIDPPTTMHLPQELRKNEIKPFLLLASVAVLSYLFTVAVRGDKLKLGSILGQWMWYYHPRDVGPKLWFPYSIFVVTMAYLLFIKRWLSKGNLGRLAEVLLVSGLVLIVFVLNMSVFSLSMFGLDELPQIIIHSGRTSFFTDAVKITDFGEFLRGYAKNVGSLTHHSQVHGPGPILLFSSVYKAFRQLTISDSLLFRLNGFLRLNLPYMKNLLVSSGMPGDNAALLTSVFMGLFFPLAASFTILPLYYLGSITYDKTVALYACGIFSVIPVVSLFTPQLAQLFTLFGVSTTLLVFLAIRTRKATLAVAAGLAFAISLFFGLELVALVPIWVTGFLFSGAFSERLESVTGARTSELVKLMIPFIATVVLFFLALFLIFGFNAFESYRNSMAIHDVLEVRRPYAKWAWANFVEFFVFLGAPMTLLFLRRLVRRFKYEGRRRVDVFFLSFILTMAALDVSGVNRGEVARLWMFLVPFVALFVGLEITSFDLSTKRAVPAAVFVVLLLEFSYAVSLKSILLTLPLRMF